MDRQSPVLTLTTEIMQVGGRVLPLLSFCVHGVRPTGSERQNKDSINTDFCET